MNLCQICENRFHAKPINRDCCYRIADLETCIAKAMLHGPLIIIKCNFYKSIMPKDKRI